MTWTRLLIGLCAGVLCELSLELAVAQFEGPSPERMFGFLDRNRDGRIDRDEVDQAWGPMRDALRRIPMDRGGLSQRDFEQVMPRLMDEFRRQREGDSRSGSFGRDDGRRDDDRRGDDRRDEYRRDGDGRGPDDYRRSGDYNRSGDGRSSSSGDSRSSSRSLSRRTPKPKVRVTLDLPKSFEALDIDFDGQIGLYEWDRAKYAEFIELDRNADGILTPRELQDARSSTPSSRPNSASVASSISATSPSSTTSAPTTAGTTAGSSSSAGSGSANVAPVTVDPNSSEGRMAKYVFGRLDSDRDGMLTEDEWRKSETTRRAFEKVGAKLSFPIDADKFAGWQVAVQRTERR